MSPRATGHEPDAVPMTRIVASVLGVVAVMAALALWTRHDERAAEDRGTRTPPTGPTGEPPRAVFLGPIADEQPGVRARAEAAARLREWAWEDREALVVRMPIERAMEIAALRSEITATLRATPGATAAAPGPASVRPEDVRVDERLGAQVPLDLAFVNEHGQPRTLRDVVVGERPTVLVLAYERCPNLCGLVLRGLAHSLAQSKKKLGPDYRALVVSIDPTERAEEALHQQSVLLGVMGRENAGASWPFLTGREPAIETLAHSVGFVYAKIPNSGDFAHPAVAVVLTPQGKISRYLYGIEFPKRDLELSLIEASEGRSGSSFDRILLRCYRYDPATRRYALAVRSFLRAGGLIVLASVAGFLVWLRRASSSRTRLEGSAA